MDDTCTPSMYFAIVINMEVTVFTCNSMNSNCFAKFQSFMVFAITVNTEVTLSLACLDLLIYWIVQQRISSINENHIVIDTKCVRYSESNNEITIRP